MLTKSRHGFVPRIELKTQRKKCVDAMHIDNSPNPERAHSRLPAMHFSFFNLF
jgi:hypothetical protein